MAAWWALISVTEANSLKEVVCCSRNWKKWPLRNEVALGLDYWWISWPTTGYSVISDHWKSQQARHFRGRLEWRRQNTGYFPACNAIVMLKRICSRTKGCIPARETNNNEKGTAKLEQGLNFTVNVDYWFCSDDFYKHPQGKKRNFCRFSVTFCSCPNSNGDILQKDMTFLCLLNIPFWGTFYSVITTDS